MQGCFTVVGVVTVIVAVVLFVLLATCSMALR